MFLRFLVLLPALLFSSGCLSDALVDPETHGILTVTSAPSGAQIVIDGDAGAYAARTPHTYLSMPSGKHDIRLVLTNYHSSVAQVLVSAGQHMHVYSVLAPIYVGIDRELQLINDLADAFAGRDVTRYGRLLGPGFVFRLRPDDVRSGLPDTLGISEELHFADGMFTRGSSSMQAAREIEVDFEVQSSQEDNRTGHQGWKIYEVRARLTATLSGGVAVSLDSPARLTLRNSYGAEGLWQLAEWDDQGPSRPTGSGPGGAQLPLSWGQLRVRYQ